MICRLCYIFFVAFTLACCGIGYTYIPAPKIADLSITYIHREPGTPSWRGFVEVRDGIQELKPDAPRLKNRWPKPGAPVTFTAHIKNQGNILSGKALCIWRLDSKVLKTQNLPPVQPASGVRLRLSWKWENGQHNLSVEVKYLDPTTPDLSKKNQQIAIRTDALPFCFYVHRRVEEAFRKNINRFGSFSFADWLQAHIYSFNHTLQESKYPAAPDGCKEQIYVDRIAYFETPEVLCALREKYDVNAQGTLVFSEHKDMARWAANWDAEIPHTLCDQLGFVDMSVLDLDARASPVIGPDGNPLYWRYVHKPLIIIMKDAGDYRFSEFCVMALNRQYGRPRGFSGDFFFDMADEYILFLRDRLRYAVEGARVRVYQKARTSGIGRQPIYEGFTDQNGCLILPNRPAPSIKTALGFAQHPNPFGKIDLFGRNGLLLFEVRARGQTSYIWRDISDFNLTYWAKLATCTRKDEKISSVTLEIQTDIPAGGAPSAPVRFRGDPIAPTITEFHWLPSLHTGIKKYRIYAMQHRAGFSGGAFSFVREISAPATSIGGIPFANVDTYYAVTAVDPQGRDSALSNWIYIPACLRLRGLAISPEGQYYTNDEETGRIHRMDNQGRFMPFYIHPPEDLGEHLANVAWTPHNELAICNLSKDRIEFYDNAGGFLRILGKSGVNPGEFHAPVDIAFNPKEEMAIADMGNRRIQIFSLEGRYLGRLGEGLLEQPIALAFSAEGELHVLDTARKRCFVFTEGLKHKFYLERTYGDLHTPVDIIVKTDGTTYISDPARRGILVYAPDGKLIRLERPAPYGNFTRTEPYGIALDARGCVLYVDRASSHIRSMD